MVVDEQTVAATCIQRLARGYLVRKRMRSVRMAIRVLEEIRNSEINYAQQLHVLANFILPPLIENLAGRPQSSRQSTRHLHASSEGLSPGNNPSSMLNLITAVYSYMQDLSRVHWSLAGQVSSLNSSWRGVAGCFTQVADRPNHELYANYCVAFDQLSFQQLPSKKSMLDTLMADLDVARLIRNGVVQGKRALASANASPPKWGEPKLASLLILPIQRLPRYLLLMDEVTKAIRQLPDGWPLISELTTLISSKQELEVMAAAVNSSKQEDDISLNSERVACYIGQDREWLEMETEAAVIALIGHRFADEKREPKRSWLKRLFRSQTPSSKKRTSRGSPIQRRSPPHRSIGQFAATKRELVLEVDLDLVESPTRGNASYLIEERHRKIVRLFVMSDIVVITSKVGARLSAVAAITIKNLTTVVYHGAYGVLSEKTPISSYPYYRQQEFEFADPEPQKASVSRMRSSSTSSYSTLVRNTSVLNPSLLSCGAVSRLVQALVTLCSDATQIVNCLSDESVDFGSSDGAVMLDGLMLARRMFSAADKASITKSGKTFTYTRDEEVIRQGETFSGLFMIIHGQVSTRNTAKAEVLQNDHSKSRDMTVGTRHQTFLVGDIFGEGGIITGANLTTMRVDSESAELLVITPAQLFVNLKSSEGLCARFCRLAVDSFCMLFSGKKLVADGSQMIAELVCKSTGSTRVQQTHVESNSEMSTAPTVTSEVANLFHIPEANLVCHDAADVQIRRRSGALSGTVFVLSLGLGFVGGSYGLMHRDLIPWSAISSYNFRPAHTLVIETSNTSESEDEVGEATRNEVEMIEVLFRSSDDARRCFGAFDRAKKQSQADRAHMEQGTWDMQKSDWELVFQLCASVDLPSNGTTVLQAGRVQNEPTVWIIAAGSCSVVSKQGEVQAHLRPGEIFGATTFLTGGKENVTITTSPKMRGQVIRQDSTLVEARRTLRGVVAPENSAQRRATTLRPRSQSMRAVSTKLQTAPTRTRLMKVSQQTLRHLFTTHPGTVVRLYRMLAKNVAQRELEWQEDDGTKNLVEVRPRSCSTVA